MRDLEIRGAGNLLGPEQSGQITAVGFDLYCQLLKQSVAAAKGEVVKPRVEVQVRFDFLALNPGEETSRAEPKKKPGGKSGVRNQYSTRGGDLLGLSGSCGGEAAAASPPRVSAYIPLSYISEAPQRIEVYRKLAQATEKAALDQLQTELRDRFGTLPPALEMLLLIGELKVLASAKGVTLIEVKEDKLMLTRNNDYIMLGGKFPRLTKIEARARLKEIKKLLLAL